MLVHEFELKELKAYMHLIFTFIKDSYPFLAALLTPFTDDSFQASGMAQAPPCTIIQGWKIVCSSAFRSSGPFMLDP